MKHNNKGFTLIELLAVIVILAIIALISTPIILNVINDSRRKAAKDSSYGVIKAIQLAFTQNQNSECPTNKNNTITFNGNASTVLEIPSSSTGESCPTGVNKTKISIGGDIPTSGQATLDIGTGAVKLEKIKFGSFYCSTYGADGGADNKVCCTTDSNGCTNEASEK